MPFRLPKISEFGKNALLVGAVTVLGLVVLEVDLRMSGTSFDRREPPAWLQKLIDPPLPAMPTRRDPISDVVLPPVDSSRCPTPAGHARGHSSRRQAAAAGTFGLAAAAALSI